ncbi:TlpA family protein disulfide reductase [Mangrovitalea sediminis]|uniref:TlpA family protein disulfide reductase n=1 Tax=Mangrovitalea sediminis TaxID=1982043 RepID=UPI001D0D03E0|nr:TlpA disulfide reductase family protein [Mangrovitalea sediminis]
MKHPEKWVGFLLLAFFLSGCSRSVSLTDADGRTIDWQSLRGQWVVVNYWAQWCGPCHREVPELNRLDEDPQVTVLGVNYDNKQGAALKRAIEDMGIHYRVLAVNPGEQLGWKIPLSLPATYLIDPQGKLEEARFGVQTRQGLLKRIRQHASIE